MRSWQKLLKEERKSDLIQTLNADVFLHNYFQAISKNRSLRLLDVEKSLKRFSFENEKSKNVTVIITQVQRMRKEKTHFVQVIDTTMSKFIEKRSSFQDVITGQTDLIQKFFSNKFQRGMFELS